jgi:multidrug efflux pump subunit AcrA (membrane-fusion protein)
MLHALRTSITRRVVGRVFVAVCLAALAAAPGCSREEKSRYVSVTKPQVVRLIKPESRDIIRIVGQPSFIESYERTSIYPKLVGYIEKWNVDIGDKVTRGAVLATLFVPELVEEHGTKKATVKLDEERVELALKVVQVAEADVQAAEAQLRESESILGKFQSEVDRWDSEVKRLDREVKRGVVDPQILLESTNQFKSSSSARDAAKATIDKSRADLFSRQAALAKARVDVQVAKADLAVAQSEERRIAAWVGYITLTSPFDGVVVTRNANTGDFVTPTGGDPTALQRSPNLSPSGMAAPIYTVDRTDIVRVFVDIPEQDANYVQAGTKASVLVRAFRDEPIPGSVTRTSWALNIKSRTLRAEIDLPNTQSELLPGMYAYARVIIERPGVLALPASALVHSGDKTYCWTYRDGKAARAEIRAGVGDGVWCEITNLKTAAVPADPVGDGWKPVDGSEDIILGDLSILTEGKTVEVAPNEGEPKPTPAKVAEAGGRGRD